MTVSGIPAALTKLPEVGGAQGPRRPNVRALREALQTGDMNAAKEAFAKVYKNVKDAPTDAAHDGIASNIKRLVVAVNAGDISAAQDALKSLDANRGSVSYAPGQLPGVVRDAGKDFLGLVRAIRSGDAAAASAALDQLRDGVKSHFEGQDPPMHTQPIGTPVRARPVGEPMHTQ